MPGPGDEFTPASKQSRGKWQCGRTRTGTPDVRGVAWARGRLVRRTLSKRLACRRATEPPPGTGNGVEARKGQGQTGSGGVGVRRSPKGYLRAHFPGRPPRAARHMAGWVWVGAVHWCRSGDRRGRLRVLAAPERRRVPEPKREAFRKKAGQDRIELPRTVAVASLN